MTAQNKLKQCAQPQIHTLWQAHLCPRNTHLAGGFKWAGMGTSQPASMNFGVSEDLPTPEGIPRTNINVIGQPPNHGRSFIPTHEELAPAALISEAA